MSVRGWMLRKFKTINRDRMKQHVELIHQNSGRSKPYIYLSMIGAMLKRGAGYTDYFRGNYIDLSSAERDTFVTAKKFYKIIHYLNDDYYKVILDDKLVFNRYFKDFLGRDYLNLREADFEEFLAFLDGKQVVFAKMPIGEGGHGVKKIDLEASADKKALYDGLISDGYLLLEEAIVQCEAVNQLNPCVVNSFRVVTLRRGDGEVVVLRNAFRINQDAANVIGSTNDLYFSVGEDGRIDSNVIDDYGNVYETHPMTGTAFKDVVIPGVREAFDLCCAAAKRLPQERYIGWDVAFSVNGPVIVEGNQYPGYGILQHYKLKDRRTGHLKEIADVLGDEIKNIK